MKMDIGIGFMLLLTLIQLVALLLKLMSLANGRGGNIKIDWFILRSL